MHYIEWEAREGHMNTTTKTQHPKREIPQVLEGSSLVQRKYAVTQTTFVMCYD